MNLTPFVNKGVKIIQKAKLNEPDPFSAQHIGALAPTADRVDRYAQLASKPAVASGGLLDVRARLGCCRRVGVEVDFHAGAGD